MKKVLSIVLSALLTAVLFTSCADSGNSKTEETTAAAKTDAELSAYINDKLADIKYNGVIYLTHNDNIVFQRATGTDENGDPLTIDTSMYIGSVSKQFCAAAVMILRDQGKLSVDDTIDKYLQLRFERKNLQDRYVIRTQSRPRRDEIQTQIFGRKLVGLFGRIISEQGSVFPVR